MKKIIAIAMATILATTTATTATLAADAEPVLPKPAGIYGKPSTNYNEMISNLPRMDVQLTETKLPARQIKNVVSNPNYYEINVGSDVYYAPQDIQELDTKYEWAGHDDVFKQQMLALNGGPDYAAGEKDDHAMVEYMGRYYEIQQENFPKINAKDYTRLMNNYLKFRKESGLYKSIPYGDTKPMVQFMQNVLGLMKGYMEKNIKLEVIPDIPPLKVVLGEFISPTKEEKHLTLNELVSSSAVHGGDSKLGNTAIRTIPVKVHCDYSISNIKTQEVWYYNVADILKYLKIPYTYDSKTKTLTYEIRNKIELDKRFQENNYASTLNDTGNIESVNQNGYSTLGPTELGEFVSGPDNEDTGGKREYNPHSVGKGIEPVPIVPGYANEENSYTSVPLGGSYTEEPVINYVSAGRIPISISQPKILTMMHDRLFMPGVLVTEANPFSIGLTRILGNLPAMNYGGELYVDVGTLISNGTCYLTDGSEGLAVIMNGITDLEREKTLSGIARDPITFPVTDPNIDPYRQDIASAILKPLRYKYGDSLWGTNNVEVHG